MYRTKRLTSAAVNLQGCVCMSDMEMRSLVSFEERICSLAVGSSQQTDLSFFSVCLSGREVLCLTPSSRAAVASD